MIGVKFLVKSGGQRSASNGGSKKKKQLIIASVGLIVLVLGGLGAYTTYVNGTVKEWNNKIYPGVTVKGIDLGGKTKEEGKAILEESFSKNIQDKKIVVKVKDRDKEYDTKYSELDPKFEIDKAVDEAFNYGKDNSLFKKNSLIKEGELNKHEIQLNFTYSDEKLNKLEDKIIKKFNIAAKNAKINIDNSGNI